MITKALVLGMMAFIHNVTGLPIPEEVPKIAIVSQTHLYQWYYDTDDTPWRGDVIPVELYSPRRGGLIKIDENLDLDTVEGESIVFHALVHHMQFYSMKEYECNNKRELEAYTTQDVWLQSKGWTLFKNDEGKPNMGYNIGMLIPLITCPTTKNPLQR